MIPIRKQKAVCVFTLICLICVQQSLTCSPGQYTDGTGTCVLCPVGKFGIAGDTCMQRPPASNVWVAEYSTPGYIVDGTPGYLIEANGNDWPYFYAYLDSYSGYC